MFGQISRIFGWNPKMFHISAGPLVICWAKVTIKISRRYSTWIEWVILYGKLLKDPRVASFIQIDLPLYPYQYSIIFHSYPMIRSYPVIFPSLAVISREGKSPFIINHHHECYESPDKSAYKIIVNPMFGCQVIKHNNHHEIIHPISLNPYKQSRKLKVHEKDKKRNLGRSDHLNHTFVQTWCMAKLGSIAYPLVN